MFTQTFRRTLVALSVLVVAIALAPPPAAGAGAPVSLPGLVPFPAPATAAATAPAAPAAGAPPASAAVRPDPASEPQATEVLDVYSGLSADPDPTVPEAAPAGTTTAPAGVAPEVRAAVASGGTAAVVIRLREQADLAEVAQQAAAAGQAAAAAAARALQWGPLAAQVARDAARDARGQVVVDALRTTADASQPPVRALLERHDAAGVREFWVFNGLTATVDAATLDALAAHPQVASVTLDETITLEEPAPTETGEDRKSVV